MVWLAEDEATDCSGDVYASDLYEFVTGDSKSSHGDGGVGYHGMIVPFYRENRGSKMGNFNTSFDTDYDNPHIIMIGFVPDQVALDPLSFYFDMSEFYNSLAFSNFRKNMGREFYFHVCKVPDAPPNDRWYLVLADGDKNIEELPGFGDMTVYDVGVLPMEFDKIHYRDKSDDSGIYCGVLAELSKTWYGSEFPDYSADIRLVKMG